MEILGGNQLVEAWDQKLETEVNSRPHIFRHNYAVHNLTFFIGLIQR